MGYEYTVTEVGRTPEEPCQKLVSLQQAQLVAGAGEGFNPGFRYCIWRREPGGEWERVAE